MLAKASSDRDKGVPIVSEKESVEQFLMHWLEVMKPSLKPRTWFLYRQLLLTHAIPAFGKLKLTKLLPQHVQGLYSRKIVAGLSSTTVHHLHALLHRAFSQAYRWGLVTGNVCDLVEAPAIAHHEMQVLTPEQAKVFLEAARGHRLEALFVLARRSETEDRTAISPRAQQMVWQSRLCSAIDRREFLHV
jgi:integrase